MKVKEKEKLLPKQNYYLQLLFECLVYSFKELSGFTEGSLSTNWQLITKYLIQEKVQAGVC